MNIQTTAIIRSRGQLTIPESIRKSFSWLVSESVVKIIFRSSHEMLIIPYSSHEHVNWQELWDGIKKIRSFKGVRGNLTKFIIDDRDSH